MDLETQQLHIFFFPFMAPGHTIPMLRMADLFSSRRVKSTVLTTPINADLVHESTTTPLLNILNLIPSTSSEAYPHLTSLTASYLRSIVEATDLLRGPLYHLLNLHRPDCIISDALFSWTTDLAAELGIPRLTFHTSGFFPLCCTNSIARLAHVDTEAPFVIPGLPHRIEMRSSQLPDYLRSDQSPAAEAVTSRLQESEIRSYGVVVNSFYQMESEYAEHYKKATGVKAWHFSPVSPSVVTSNSNSNSNNEALKWLDSKEPRSVVYMCFGSLGRFTTAHLREIALGLVSSNHPFLWVVKNGEMDDDGFDESIRTKGLIVRGWAPQVMILSHPAIGGFVTHCGWNSTLEGVSSGVPMMTWPLFAEQFFNERLIVDVLGIGIGVGAEVCSSREGERAVVRGEDVREAVNGLMGGGDEAEERRRRARELGEKARSAVEKGGSSFNDMDRLIEELIDVKASRLRSRDQA